MARKIRKMWLDEELREALREHAYQTRTSMGEVVREVIATINDDETLNAEALAVADTPGTLAISVEVDDDDWYDARQTAAGLRLALASLVRRHLRLIFND
jgi:hypothetical protein